MAMLSSPRLLRRPRGFLRLDLQSSSMTTSNPADLYQLAAEVLRENDRGSYTVPTKGLYPFQWNWDSCLTALGQRHFDEARAWIEIETLFQHQWPDGMVPHIVFHAHSDGYFPGPDVWNTGVPSRLPAS